ncbi:response regulator [Desulfococcaceae bacterium HSG9]|nr:response regulator [Desulfococcaceae bacterium HSG9]
MSEKKRSLILLVDDNVRNLQLLGSLLNESYKTAIALDGVDALSFVRKRRPDLILLDVMMPKMNGFQVCEILKAEKETKEIPIIFLTGKTDSESVVKGFEIGANDYIQKPFKQKELLARVKTHISLQEAHDIQKRLISEKEKLISELQEALKEIKTLRGFIPICSFCKKIRNDDQYWEEVDVYIHKHAEVSFSHGICPDCVVKHYPEFSDKVIERLKKKKAAKGHSHSENLSSK